MKTRVDYNHNGTRYPIKLTGYGLKLLANQPVPNSAAITAALVEFLGTANPATVMAFCDLYDMSLSVLVEIALSRHLDR